VASGDASPDAALARDETLEAVRLAIDGLSHDLKVTLLLHHYEHLSYREIAEITHCSERGVETRLYRARQQLRDQLATFIRETSPC
jgi:RNA polymerase sigma-70 factor (ECF subfamily)